MRGRNPEKQACATFSDGPQARLGQFGPDGFFIMPDRELESETAGREFIKSMEVD